MQSIRELHSYRVILIPQGVDLAEVENMDAAGQLQSIRLRAANSEQAEKKGHFITGQNVLRAERVEM